MKKIYKTSTKIWMTILCSLLAVIMLSSFLGMIALAEGGFYDSSKTAEKRLNEKADDAYATWAFANYYGGEVTADTNIDLKGTGFSYGIIKGNVDADDITSGVRYADRNFSGELPKEFGTKKIHVGEHPSYYLSKSILGENYIDAGIHTVNKVIDIQGIGYDVIDRQIYIWDGETYYPLSEEFAYPIEAGYYDSSDDDEYVNTAYQRIWKNQEPKETDTETGSNLLYMGGRGFPSMEASGWNQVLYLSCWQEFGGLKAQYVADVSEIHSQLQELKNSNAKLDRLTSADVGVTEGEEKTFTVVYFTEKQPDMKGGWFDGNLYTQAAILNKWVRVLTIALPIVMVASMIGAIWLLVLLMCAAGHRYGEEGIVAGALDRVPVDLMFVIVCGIELMLMLPMEALVCSLDFGYSGVICGGLLALIVFVGCIVGLVWLMTVATNIKLGHWWENTIICRLLHVLKAAWGRLMYESKAIGKTVHWQKRAWIIFGVFVFLELFGMALLDAGGNLAVPWLCEKIIFALGLHYLLKFYARLKDGAMRMAEGDRNVVVDTRGLPLDFEEHAQALNKINSGLSTAVAEQLKSERMKTELITNVSHDIKTPLTSIINYVDLLEKEQIDNEKAKEYLDVLDRQSNRLKKLIEDLIEASKAATGNINFQMEAVNARMILNQSIGEFAERLEKGQITLVSNVPEEDIYVWADNRYLWRVFDNLMNNIAKYAQPGTRAYIDLKQHDGKVEFTFRNTSKNELNITADELMERFVRGDASRNTEGNGLGLSIARSLTESMDGSMNLAIDGDLFKVILEFTQK